MQGSKCLASKMRNKCVIDGNRNILNWTQVIDKAVNFRILPTDRPNILRTSF